MKASGHDSGRTDVYEDTCTWIREISKKADLESKDFTIDTKEKVAILSRRDSSRKSNFK